MLLILLLKYLLAKATKENHCLPIQRLYGKKQKLSDLRAFLGGIFSITFSCCDAERYFAAVSMHHLQNSSNFSSAPSPFATQSQEKCMIQTDKFATVRLSNDLEVFKVARVHGSLGEDKSWLTQRAVILSDVTRTVPLEIAQRYVLNKPTGTIIEKKCVAITVN